MRRIQTATRSINKHGTGRDGFDESPTIPATTQLSPEWFDHVQEELARLLELHGVTLNSLSLDQVATLSLRLFRHLHRDAAFIESGFDISDQGGLNIRIHAGTYFHEGIRVYLSDAVISAEIAVGGIITMTDNTTNDIYVLVDSDAESCQFFVGTNSSGPPSYDVNLLYLGRVITSGGDITSIARDNYFTQITSNDTALNFSRIPLLGPFMSNLILPKNEGLNGYSQLGSDRFSYLVAASGNSAVRHYFDRAHLRQIIMRPDEPSTDYYFNPQSMQWLTYFNLDAGDDIDLLLATDAQLQMNAGPGPAGAAVAIGANNGPYIDIIIRLLGMTSTVSTNNFKVVREVTGHFNVSTDTWTQLDAYNPRQFIGPGSVAPTLTVSYVAATGLFLNILNNSGGTVHCTCDLKVVGTRFGHLASNELPDA